MFRRRNCRTKLLIPLALPREASEVSEFNDLPKGLGEDCPIDLQGVSESLPKPSGTGDGSEAWPVMGRDAYFDLAAGVRRDRLPRLEVHDE
jgi:hypothetical protein